MQGCEFQVLRRWLTARLRERGVTVCEDDLDLAYTLAEFGLHTVADVIRLEGCRLEAIAVRIGQDISRAT